MTPADLIERVAGCGFRVVLSATGEPRLRQDRKVASVPPDLMAELKAGKAAVTAWLREAEEAAGWERCGRCAAEVRVAEAGCLATVCPYGGGCEYGRRGR